MADERWQRLVRVVAGTDPFFQSDECFFCRAHRGLHEHSKFCAWQCAKDLIREWDG